MPSYWRSVLIAGAFTATLAAQTETGQITGTIVDPAGAVVVGATIRIVSPQRGIVREVPSSGTGTFAVTNLQPGAYQVTTTKDNFATDKREVDLGVGARAAVTISLQLGSTTTIIEVTGTAEINTSTQTMAERISGAQILNLPTLTRNPYALISTVGNTTTADPAGADRGVGVAINGLRSSDVGILLDGVPNSNNFDTRVGIKTPLDSVGEVTVLTNGFTAEYGRALAGIINVETRSGSNTLHGTVYEFNRVSALASNSFDNNANQIGKATFVRNQFGFSAGGAIVKDKLFVFGNPEWIRVRSQQIQTATIATPALIAASDPATKNFFNTYGHLKSDLTPLQTFTRSSVCNTGACLAIPAATPIYQKVAYGVPADSGGGDPQNTLEFAGKVDYNLTEKTQMYFRYARYYADLFPGSVTNSPYVGYDTGESSYDNGYAVSVTHLFSPTWVSQTKVSYNRIGLIQPLSTAPIGPTLYTTLSATNSLGNAPLTYPGYSPFTPGNSIPFGGPQNYYQLNQDTTKTTGSHSFRFGGVFTLLNDNRTFGAYENAVEALGTNVESAVNGLVSGQASNFQAAIYPQGKYPCIGGVVTPACTLTLPVGPPSFSRSNLVHEAGLYAQDNWKVTRTVSLNLGLRWEYFGPQANRDRNLDSNFYLGPGSNLQVQSGTGQVLTSTDPKNPNGGLWKKQWNLFSPRVGMAWDVFGDGKTSVRGGYGIGYVPNFGNVTFNVIQNPPNYGVVALTAGADVPSIPITTDNSGPLAGSSGTKPLGPVTLRAVNPNIRIAYSHLWNFSVEHDFGRGLFVSLDYTGSAANNLYTINRLNIPGSQLLYNGTGSKSERINSQYSYINYRDNGGSSRYHGMNARVEMRNFANTGLSFRANYTLSHAIDNASNTFGETSTGSGNLGLLDPLHPEIDRGNADFDVRNRFSLAGVWDVPYHGSGIKRQIFGGWSVIPNWSAYTGTPFSLWDCTNAGYILCPRAMYSTPFTPKYENVSTGQPNQFRYMSVGTPDSSYVNPVVGVSDFGPFPSNMTGRNIFRGPGNWNLDVAVHKNVFITERVKLQLRAEAYNIMNHSNLYLVNSNTDVSATSQVTAARGIRADNTGYNTVSTDNRNLQLAVKLIF